MPIRLYTIGNVAEVLDLPARPLRWWADKGEKAIGYVEPYAISAKINKGEHVFLKLWHHDQLEFIKEGFTAYKKFQADEAVATAKRRKEREKIYNALYYAQIKAQREKDAQAFIERDTKEREERAMQFLIEKDLV